MPATFLANSFRNPLGNGLTSPENDGDGFYVAFGFDEPNPDIGGSRHLGVDWNGEGGGNTDLGAPVHAIGNGIVVAVISNQGTATTGFGNYIVLRHDLPEPTLINGQWVTQVHSLYAHLDTVSALSVGQQLGIGTQIGTLGRSGYADVAHLHLEITIGNVLPTDDDGYNPSGAPSGWVDPVAFVNERLSAAASTTNTDMLTAARFGIAAYSLAGNESPMSGSDRANSAASTEYTALQGEGWRYLTSAEAGLTTLNSGAVGEAAGFFVVGNAAALVAVRDNTLVLSFRGTNDTGLTPGTDHWDWVHRDVHFNNFADTFLDQLRSYLSSHSEITEVLVTGHSLGAAMVDALFMSSWDLRNLRPSSLDVVGINFADPGYQLGSDVGAASSDLTTLNFNEDVINFASDFSDLAGDFTRIFTPDSGTSWTTYHSMQGYLSLVSYMTDLGITADQVNAFNGTFFVNGVVAPCGQAFIVAQYGSRISPNGDQNNFFVGGLGSDEIYGGAYSDTLIGGGGNDDLRGLDSADLLRGSDGNDVLYGGLSHDYLWGEDDNDLLRGESGNDFLYGGDGADDLRGDGGLDRLEGGSGADKLAGGLASDVFSFADDDFPLFQSVNPDQITDYNRGAGTLAAAEGDVIDLSGINFATSNGSGSTSTVRLRSIEASGGLPAGAILEINIGDDIWRGIARLDGVGAGEAVRIALTDAQSAARTGSTFVVDAVGNGTTWSISPATRNVSEGNVTISFTITRSGANLGAETVYVSTAQTQGFYNDGDYVGRLNVPVVFAAGDLSETFTVRINADAVPEGDETFGVIVQSDSRDSASIFLASATFTIQDGAPPTVSGSNYIGDSLDNIWSGTSGQDLALGMGGNDRLTGGGGNDILSGGDGDDSLYGGGGNDIIVNGDGTDYVDSGAGNDYIDARQVRNGRDTVLGGSGDDTILAGSANNGVYGDTRATIDGGTGEDLLVLEARSDGNYTAGQIRHQFGSGPILDANTEFTTISEQLAETGTHLISSGLYSYSDFNSWYDVSNIDRIEYRGDANRPGNNLFLEWGTTVITAAYGVANATDTLWADWSGTTAAILWNLTVDNDTVRTLGNGVTVQSIDRVHIQTGSGNDRIILQDASSHTDYVDSGAGNDYIDARQVRNGRDTVLGGSGDDTILAGSANNGVYGDTRATIDGGTGEDLLVLEARSDGNYTAGQIRHQFGSGPILDANTEFTTISEQLAETGTHLISSGLYSYSDFNSWYDVSNIDRIEYRGDANRPGNNLFLEWGTTVITAAYGVANATDTLWADWSGTTAAILWNLTVDNDTVRTLGNGVTVQSIDRVHIQTGSGNDRIILQDASSHTDYVDSGAGNDYIDARQVRNGRDTVLGGSGDDTILAGSGNSSSFGDTRATIDGGTGDDLLVLEARSDGNYTAGQIRHQFGSGPILDANTEFSTISEQLAETGTHLISSGYYGFSSYIYNSWYDVSNIDRIEYRGATTRPGNNLFLEWGTTVITAAYGVENATDTLWADWSGTTAAILWNLTVDNDTVKTLGNGVSVQSIDRVHIQTGSGDDSLVGGNFDDHFDTGAGRDIILTGGGNNYVDAGSGDDQINGGSGNDTLVGGHGIDQIDGGAGDDQIIAGTGSDYLLGDLGNDSVTLIGTAYHTARYVAYNVSSANQTGTGQRINLDGKVKIEAVIDGGSDINTIYLGDPGDAFFLHDAYSGFHHSLTLASDYIGNDSMQRFVNIQRIFGMEGDDIIDLTSPDYSLAGASIMIDGGEGNDVIWGSDADEMIYGRAGDDTIFGGTGTDVLFGGSGADVFEFTKTSTDTTVADFNPGEGDLLRFYNRGGAQFDPASIGLTDDGIRITFSEAGSRHEIEIALAASAAEFNLSLGQVIAATEFI